ncbi:response regulator [Leptolyngbya ohadii]|uniref:response regulator n=1 Tax=Leptolyngbya ohadii TaxID=1962290 RepID=UPI0015C5DAA9|nr:response regulator [Leptolyngbya ohadii]
MQYCPQLAGGSSFQRSSSQDVNCVRCWNYQSLVHLVQQGQIQQSHLSSIVAGNLLEVVFDLIQTLHLSPQPVKMHLTSQPLAASSTDSSWLVSFEAARIWQQAAQAWSVWQQSGLERISPNLAPLIWDSEGLRQQTSLLTYHNLTAFANGYWTLRDLAIRLKQPIVPLTQSLMPYIKQGIMGLNPVGDIRVNQQSSRQFVIAYVEDSGFDSTAMNQILDRAGHRLISIPDPLQAIPILLEQKPDLIFLDLLMPIANGYEVCTQIRRITAFKDVPIVILTGSNGIVDRVRAKLAGASGFLSKPIEPDKVLNTLRQTLPGFTSQ